MSSRPKLDIVDDPVARHPTQRPETLPTARAPRQRSTSASVSAAPSADSSRPTAAHTPAEPAAELAERPQAARYGQERKKAVFGRVPRTLSRRLERAVLELREEADDLTQEQVLAALLDKYVNPADFDNLSELAATVNEYRSRL